MRDVLDTDGPSQRAASSAIVRATVLTALLAALLVTGPGPRAREAAVHVRIDTASRMRNLSPFFQGLSLEKEQMTCGRLRPDNGPLVALMRLVGRGTLRLGGNTVDVTEPPTAAQVASTLGLARAAGWKVIYGLNLGADRPLEAAREAREVWAQGADVVLAFEVGNEPDLYALQKLRPASWNVAAYLAQFSSYRRALAGLPLSGPGAGSIYDSLAWVLPFLDHESAGLAFASVHFYPMVAKTPLPPDSPARPTLAHLLSPRIADALASRLFVPQIEAARRRGLPFRVTESNTAARGGQAGVSDVFASALWLIDWTLRLQVMGADGIDVQADLLNPRDLYTPLLEEGGILRARPMFYGMLLLGRLREGALLTTSVDSSAPHLRAYAVSGENLQVVLVNTGTLDLRVRLEAPGASAKVLRLTAPSLTSRDSVTLGGRAIAPDGSWQPAAPEWLRQDEDGDWMLSVAGGSAALVELPSRWRAPAP